MSNPYRINLHVILAGDDNDVTVYPPGTNVSTVETLVDDLNTLFSHIDIQFDFDVSTDLEEIRNTVVNND
ncbi:MAG: hypothetical protein GY941_23035 [Planctomycetes bacterium]|nr:hypothetical protein [Planctomycetota bacterium]